MSDAVEAPDAPEVAWGRLERAAHAAASAVAEWRRRATEAEAEVGRLRRELELVTAPADGADSADELRRLRAENALLSSRGDEARQRIRALLAKLAVLEGRR